MLGDTLGQFPGPASTPIETAQLQALAQVMAIAEFSPAGVLLQANAIYRQLLGLTAQTSDIHHRHLCPPTWANSSDYQAFWERLRSGQPQSGIMQRLGRQGQVCWLEASYTPVRNAQGSIVQILCVATDITARQLAKMQELGHLQMLSLVAEASDTAVMISDGQSKIVYVNRGFSRMFGWESQEIQGQAPIPLLAPDLPPTFSDDYHHNLRLGQPVEHEELVVGKSGQRYWAKVISNPIINPEGRWRYTVSMLTDITHTKIHETLQHKVLEAMAREQPLSEVLELVCQEVERIAPEVTASILEVDANGLLHPLASPSLPLSYSEQLDSIQIGPNMGSCGTAAWLNQSVRVEDIEIDPLWADFKHLVLPLGYQACWSTPIRNNLGKPIGTFAFYYRHKLTHDSEKFHQELVNACTHLCALALEREYTRQRIRQLAFYDALTGLPNRSLLQARADQAIASAGRNHEQLAVLFIDLDRFKQVNDSMGHPAGDELLCNMAARLRQVLRGSDIAGRLSGDEFVVVLPQCDAEHVTETIERLQQTLADPLTVQDTSLTISASIGIAMFPADGRDMETLVHRADMAMYQAKSSGRGRFSFFSSEMNRLAQERLALETALRQALKTGGLRLHYQPQVDIGSGELYGVEALARWSHAELGEIAPSRFIPLAEECGMIADLGRWALNEACEQLAQWRSKGLAVPAVSVNLSPSSFHNLDLPRMIVETLDRNALAPQDLVLELTESVLLDTNPSTLKTINEVNAHGVRLSMDDFGTGYSSLSYLRRLPVSELKLDRSFVADLEHDEAARALSRAILGIGKSLHLTVIAEGVETESQNILLRQQGYEVAQGYLFGRPMAPDELEHWLSQAIAHSA